MLYIPPIVCLQKKHVAFYIAIQEQYLFTMLQVSIRHNEKTLKFLLGCIHRKKQYIKKKQINPCMLKILQSQSFIINLLNPFGQVFSVLSKTARIMTVL